MVIKRGKQLFRVWPQLLPKLIPSSLSTLPQREVNEEHSLVSSAVALESWAELSLEKKMGSKSTNKTACLVNIINFKSVSLEWFIALKSTL